MDNMEKTRPPKFEPFIPPLDSKEVDEYFEKCYETNLDDWEILFDVALTEVLDDVVPFQVKPDKSISMWENLLDSEKFWFLNQKDKFEEMLLTQPKFKREIQTFFEETLSEYVYLPKDSFDVFIYENFDYEYGQNQEFEYDTDLPIGLTIQTLDDTPVQDETIIWTLSWRDYTVYSSKLKSAIDGFAWEHVMDTGNTDYFMHSVFVDAIHQEMYSVAFRNRILRPDPKLN